MPTKPTVRQLDELINALLGAFDVTTLAELTRVQLGLEHEWATSAIGGDDLSTVVSNLVAYFANQDDGLRRLLAAALKANPNETQLKDLQTKWVEIEFELIPLPDNHPSIQASESWYRFWA